MPTIYRFSLAPPETTLGPTADGSASVSVAVAAVRAFAVDVRPQLDNLTFAIIDTGSGGFGAVGDLAVIGVTETSVTVQWTQVQDDQGNPAKYGIRARSPTIDANTWANYAATAYVDTDLAVGVAKTHTFLDLLPGTDYGVMLIPFRGPNGDADAFGAFSNVATGTTDSNTQLGTITDLAAFSGDGEVRLTWSAAANATSHQPQYKLSTSGTWLNFGTALGGAANTVTVTGLENGSLYNFRVVAGDGAGTTNSNTASATPNELAGGLWPSRPLGLSTLSEFDISDEPLGMPPTFTFISAANDWRYITRNGSPGSGGEVVTDATEPSQMGKSMRFNYPASIINEQGNFDEAAVVHFLTSLHVSSTTECYFGWLMKWSTGWVTHPAGTKATFIFNGEGDGQSYTGNEPGKGTTVLGNENVAPQDLRSASYTVDANTWYMWEWYQERPSSLPGTGTVKLWITEWNGSAWGAPTLVLNFTRTFSATEDEWRSFEMAGTYGGGGDPNLTEDQHIYWGRAIVAAG